MQRRPGVRSSVPCKIQRAVSSIYIHFPLALFFDGERRELKRLLKFTVNLKRSFRGLSTEKT